MPAIAARDAAANIPAGGAAFTNGPRVNPRSRASTGHHHTVNPIDEAGGADLIPCMVTEAVRPLGIQCAG